MLKVLAIESSCDETAVAIIAENRTIISNLVFSQLEQHRPYQGVVPEIAARAHLDYLPELIEQSLLESNLKFSDIDFVASTGGPGLIGGVIVGVMFAKTIAYSLNKPFLAINHLEGHALTVRLTSDVEYPFLLLLVSGGHSQFIIVENIGKYHLIGSTIDDALGEAFDKVAKMLNLDYPGGPSLEKIAKNGDKNRFKFPQSLITQPNCNFSFSGLKTAIKREIEKSVSNEQDKADIAASFQYTILKIIENRLNFAINFYTNRFNNRSLVIAGGVAANLYLRDGIKQIAVQNNFKLIIPPVNLCTDNAAMIGWAAIENYKAGYISSYSFSPKESLAFR